MLISTHRARGHREQWRKHCPGSTHLCGLGFLPFQNVGLFALKVLSTLNLYNSLKESVLI